MKKSILTTCCLLCLSLPLPTLCSAQTLTIEETKVTRLEQIFNRLDSKLMEQEKQLLIAKESIENLDSQLSIAKNLTTRQDNQLTIANNSINQATNSLEKANKSFLELEKKTNDEIKKTKTENLFLKLVIGYLVLK